MRESYACIVIVFSMISTQIDSSFLVFINLSILAKKDSWKVVQCLHREPIRTSIYWSLSPLDCGNAWLMDSHHRCNCRRTTLSSCSSLLISTACSSNVSNWSSSCGWLESIKNGAMCPEVCKKLNVVEELMIMCNKVNAKHRMQSIFCKLHFNWTKKIKFSGVYNARCPLKSVCMTMTPNHNLCYILSFYTYPWLCGHQHVKFCFGSKISIRIPYSSLSQSKLLEIEQRNWM